MDGERLDLSATFADGVAALTRVAKQSVPAGARIIRSLCFGLTKRNGKKKLRWAANGSRGPDVARDPTSSSPTCLPSSLFLVLSISAQNGWNIHQYDITNPVSELTISLHLTYRHVVSSIN